MTFAILTNTGRNKEAAAIAEGIALTITEMAWGDGQHVPAGGELALENEQGRKPVQASGTVPNTPNTAFFEILLDETEGPFVIREAGLFDADGDMVAVAHYDPPVNKPLNHVSALIRTNILFSDLENLILKVQSTDAYVPAERILTAGTGLLGGGDLSEDRSFAADFATEDQALAGMREDKVMSPALVSAAINALVAGAPDALDTLNEIAAALGDDPNFSATILAELNKLKTPVVAAIVDDAALDAVNATSVLTAAQGVLNPPLAIGGTIEHTELSDGSAIQKAYRITPTGVFLTKHIRTRRTGTWSDWTADGPDIGDLVIQTHSGDLLDRLEASGAVMNRTSYADLFWRTGTTYGAGDGATTFGTLDARGEFLRGWDNGRGIDVGRGFGSFQHDEFGNHAHQIPHDYYGGDGSGDWVTYGIGVTNGNKVYGVSNKHGRWVKNEGGSETRPRNIAQMFCIKF
jgi:phage-related tail fiber protein